MLKDKPRSADMKEGKFPRVLHWLNETRYSFARELATLVASHITYFIYTSI